MSAAAATVVINVFGLFHPSALEIGPAGRLGDTVSVTCAGVTKRLEGAQKLSLEAGCEATGRFELSVPMLIRRVFEGSLRIEPGLAALITMDLETAVAAVVAAELPRDAPPAALEAQAIAARSYYAASRGRHAHGAFCDTTHCQHIREVRPSNDRIAIAVQKTRGLILDYESRIVAAMYSASCQGTRQTGPANPDGYPYFAVECPYCRRKPAKLTTMHQRGLCQSGAIDLAKQGKDAIAILGHYYPGTRVRPLQ